MSTTATPKRQQLLDCEVDATHHPQDTLEVKVLKEEVTSLRRQLKHAQNHIYAVESQERKDYEVLLMNFQELQNLLKAQNMDKFESRLDTLLAGLATPPMDQVERYQPIVPC